MASGAAALVKLEEKSTLKNKLAKFTNQRDDIELYISGACIYDRDMKQIDVDDIVVWTKNDTEGSSFLRQTNHRCWQEAFSAAESVVYRNRFGKIIYVNPSILLNANASMHSTR